MIQIFTVVLISPVPWWKTCHNSPWLTSRRVGLKCFLCRDALAGLHWCSLTNEVLRPFVWVHVVIVSQLYRLSEVSEDWRWWHWWWFMHLLHMHVFLHSVRMTYCRTISVVLWLRLMTDNRNVLRFASFHCIASHFFLERKRKKCCCKKVALCRKLFMSTKVDWNLSFISVL